MTSSVERKMFTVGHFLMLDQILADVGRLFSSPNFPLRFGFLIKLSQTK